VRALRLPVVALRRVVDALLDRTLPLPERVVAITLDDGLDFDFIDLRHPFHGPQRSAHTILRDHAQRHGMFVHASSFVIASPDARRQIARHEMLDYQWIGEQWWPEAIASGLSATSSDSLVLPALLTVLPSRNRAGAPTGIAGALSRAHARWTRERMRAGRASAPLFDTLGCMRILKQADVSPTSTSAARPQRNHGGKASPRVK